MSSGIDEAIARGQRYTAIIRATRSLQSAEWLMREHGSNETLGVVRMREAIHDLADALGMRVVSKAERECLACGREVPR